MAIDGNYLLVGAPFVDADASTTGSGAAYIFERDAATGQWPATETYKLDPTNNDANDKFGYSVALSGTTAVVGAYQDSAPDANTGSVYIFERVTVDSVVSWTQQQNMVSNNIAANDAFGTSVAISGGRVVVGAPFEDVGGSASGAAYVFESVAGCVAGDGDAHFARV